MINPKTGGLLYYNIFDTIAYFYDTPFAQNKIDSIMDKNRVDSLIHALDSVGRLSIIYENASAKISLVEKNYEFKFTNLDIPDMIFRILRADTVFILNSPSMLVKFEPVNIGEYKAVPFIEDNPTIQWSIGNDLVNPQKLLEYTLINFTYPDSVYTIRPVLYKVY